MESWKTYQAEAKSMQDRVILVTGAGQGLGATAAVELAKLGATVILLGRNEKKLSRTYDAIESVGGPQPAAVPMDLAKVGEAEITQLGVLIQKEFGRLDGILHCANGFNHLSPLANQKLDEWVDMFRVNVAAPFALNRTLLPLLQAAPDAAVLVLGETHAFEPNAYWGGFSVTKSAQKNWIEITASEWDKFEQLRINLLVPGPIQSPFRLATHPAESKDTLPETGAIMPAIMYWLGPASRGQTGQTVFFNKK
ncbi:SDR family NAD(P)-dependent oxidoreductase [Chitinibacter bivalviorum]|uniref:SDR family NAD(P)-dependent oxidoreductase n=1 Tax=Chitinibacter bivalviorum TaxID=2739434 RepID=A0A7H9BEF0_9NEIS|nr:SDR family NAD(P)-dependent oxidoreductase [Chitinibacter bivalviorum]QLG86822.1 SDR family NAD(P)-dependent oxidoreductase [Chitinibacter bivalviorum]